MRITRALGILLVLSLTTTSCVKKNIGINDKQQLSSRVGRSNAALKHLFEAGEANASQITTMLSKHDLVELEKIYESYFLKYQSDVRYESLLQSAYNVFSPDSNISLADLDYWVAKTNSYIAFAARGGYKKALGFVARGSKTIGETSAARIEDMTKLHREAVKDLQTALNRKASLMPAYVYLIAVAKASAMPFTTKEILEKAIANDKRSYLVRIAYMEAIEPRWGGSYKDMADFANQSIQYADANPLLWTLQGAAFADQAWYYWREDNCTQAIEAYTSALKFGDRTAWLKKRAGCYSSTGQKDKALEDYKKILYYNPTDEEANLLLRSLQAQMKH